MNRAHGARVLLLGVLVAQAGAAQTARPAVIAHRGGMAHRPQNTMAAFRNAVPLGAEVTPANPWRMAARFSGLSGNRPLTCGSATVSPPMRSNTLGR